MTTPHKLTIAAVVLLVCGVVVALVVRRPAGRLSGALTLTFLGYETNNLGGVMANILVSNASQRAYCAKVQDDTSGVSCLEPGKVTIFGVEQRTPRRERLHVQYWDGERRVSERIKHMLGSKVISMEIQSLELPE